jgi:hypothetical protein
MNVRDAIAEAERILPGQAAPEGAIDPRWQAIIRVEDFIRDEPEAVWAFILRWGCHADEDLRTAIATCLLEDLLKYHFADFFPKVSAAVEENSLFADTFRRCWKLGQAEQEGNGERFDQLQQKCGIQSKRD